MTGDKHMGLGDHLLTEDGAYAGMVGNNLVVGPEADVTVNGMVSGTKINGERA